MKQTGSCSQQSGRPGSRRSCLFRVFSWILLSALAAPLIGSHVTVSAENGTCPHHPEHTQECGYAPPKEASACSHQHDEACGYVTEGGGCTHQHSESCGGDPSDGTGCTHQHDDACGYTEPVCSHQHDESCGGAEASEGSPCRFVCAVCADGGERTEEPDAADEGERTEEPDAADGGESAEEPDAAADGGTEDTAFTIVSWSWDSEYLVQDEASGCWGLGVPGVSEENRLTKELLAEYLPAEAEAVLEDGSEAVLPLRWDYGAFPEEGAYEGSYRLTAGFPEGYVPGPDTPKTAVLLELGGGEPYLPAGPGDKFVNQWSYISRGGSEIAEDTDYRYSMDYYLAVTSDREELIQKLYSILPRKIKGQGYNTGNALILAGFEYAENQPPSTGLIQGYVNIRWTNVEAAVDAAGTIADNTPLTFLAEPVSSPGYRLRVNSNNTNLDAELNDTAEIPDVLNLTVTLHEIHLEDHIVSGINPPNTTVNLFDYWVDSDGAEEDDLLDKNDVHKRAGAADTSRHTGMEDWNKGINTGRLLLFGDGNIHAGYWNKGAGAASQYGQNHAGMPGIVERVLKDGYPVIHTADMEQKLDGYEGISDHMLCGDHTDTEENDSSNPQNISGKVIENWRAAGSDPSLNYLFDPEIEHQNKRSYKNATGLFQIDSNGYYYYDMRQNFAEYDRDSGKFILYDAPAVDRTDRNASGDRSIGNFLPFNTGSQVFDLVGSDGRLSSNENISSNNLKTTAGYVNHHLGMTLNIDFLQPLGGRLATGSADAPMTFQFSGDDDVWIYIDDVLVLDLGGIHSEIYGIVDFSTGEICVGQSWKTNGFPYKSDGTVDVEKLYHDAPPTGRTTIREQFEHAGKDKDTLWNGSTFASNTSHTLKMFYLERGNYDSSLAVRFNLQPQLYQQLKKVDQDGRPLEGVEFDLCPAEETAKDAAGAIRCLYTDSMVHAGSEFYVRQKEGSSFVHLRTASDGTARFLDENGHYFNFADRGDQYYILKETETPDGYRTLPVDIVLHYDTHTCMLSVANRWTTGSYACSVVHVAGTGSLTYGHFNEQTGTVDPSPGQAVSRQKQKDSLIVAVPMQQRKTDHTWKALYGSNLNGFMSPESDDHTGTQACRDAVLRAVLEQAADDRYSDWNLFWDPDNLRLTGTLNDLPGLADRYQINRPDGDMRMVFGIIEPEALQALGIDREDAGARCQALGQYVREHGTEETLNVVMGTAAAGTESGRGFSFLNTGQFIRSFRSLIYVPNEQRELWVMKIDQDGRPYNGTRFGLYDNAACAGTPAAQGVTAEVNGQAGTLIFSPSDDQSPGHARMMWSSSTRTHYYLKELSAPEGCALNDTVVPVVVGTYSIYADAGAEHDGITVMAGVGRLTQTMRQYAMNEDMDITLRDITASAQHQPSRSADVRVEDWEDAVLEGTSDIVRSLNLHYGKNAVVDYGLHDEDGGKLYRPFFVTDTGFIRARVRQNYAALAAPVYEPAGGDANKDDLGNADLTNLFSLLNIVVVTDRTDQETGAGRLSVSKMLDGPNLTRPDYTKNFTFTIRLTGADGRELKDDYYFYGTDKAGYISSGKAFPLHHDECITILGLPEGARYTVTESPNPDWYALPKSGTVGGRVLPEEISFASFYNSREPWPDVGMLTLHKTVTGAGDRTRDFTFTVTFTDKDGRELPGDFRYTGDKSGSIRSGQSVTLRHDQHVTFRLPAGTIYRAEEQEADRDGYVTVSHGETGTIEDGDMQTAAFLNDLERKEPQKPKPGSGPGSDSGGREPAEPAAEAKGAAFEEHTDASDGLDTGDPAVSLRLLELLSQSSLAVLLLLWKKKKT